MTRQENLGGEKGKGEGARPGDQAGELGWGKGEGAPPGDQAGELGKVNREIY